MSNQVVYKNVPNICQIILKVITKFYVLFRSRSVYTFITAVKLLFTNE